jgi:hypothetical protein
MVAEFDEVILSIPNSRLPTPENGDDDGRNTGAHAPSHFSARCGGIVQDER